MDTPLMERPKLTMPAQVAAHVRAAYAQADVILEYGSGGSTVLAGEHAGCTIYSVESDHHWCEQMGAWFAANPPKGTVHLHYANIGPTGKWGMPATDAQFRRWPEYTASVWERADFQHPDLVLIDGRFRLACLLMVMVRIARPVRVLMDDYADRKPYHHVERLVQPSAQIGRMAQFDLQPTAMSLPWLRLFVKAVMQPL